MRKLLLILALLGIMTSSFTALTVSATDETDATDEPQTITYTFGGENGEWETDADNSTGVWSYYASAGGAISGISDTALTLNDAQDQYSYGESYFMLCKNGFLHPGVSGDFSTPVIGLKIGMSGKLSGTLTATRDSAAATTDWATDNNGTVAKFFLNDDRGLIAEEYITQTENTKSFADKEVREGDTVYFLIHHNGNISSDGATYTFTYTLVEAEVGDLPPAEPVDPVTPISGCDCADGGCTHTADTCYCASDCECENCAQFNNKLSGTLDDVNNIDDFRYAQGVNNFTYLYGKVSEGIDGLTQLIPATANWDTQGAVPYLTIRADGLMHPGLTEDGAYMVALAWTAPKADTIDVHFDCEFEQPGNAGDGVIVGIYLNNVCLKSFKLNPEGFTDDSDPYAVEFNSIKVNQGDVLYFTINPNESLACDGVLTYLEINWVKDNSNNENNNGGSGNTGDNQDKENNAKKGCGGSVCATAPVLGVLAIAVAGIAKKRKEN